MLEKAKTPETQGYLVAWGYAQSYWLRWEEAQEFAALTVLMLILEF